MNKIILVIAWVSFVSCFTHISSADEYSAKEIKAHFNSLVYGKKYNLTLDMLEGDRLVKWEESWKVLYKGPETTSLPIAEKLIKISKLTKLQWEPVSLETWKNNNLTIIVSDFNYIKQIYEAIGKRNEYGLNFRNFVVDNYVKKGLPICHFYLEIWSDYSIIKAILLIEERPDITPKNIEICIERTLSRSLGITGVLPFSSDTIFTTNLVNNELTELDEIAIKLLYSPELKIGMTTDEVDQQLDVLISQMAH